MRIHALQTGTAELKQAFLHPRRGLAGRLRLLLPGPWVPAVPIHAWLIEHEGQRILVDTGETASVKDLPFARYNVAAGDELPHALAQVGASVDELDTVVVTHLHSDHADGAVHVNAPVLVSEAEWRAANSFVGRVAQRVSRAPLPTQVDFRPITLDDGPFGAFAANRRLTDDGRVRAVFTPGHTPGHISIIVIDDDGHHVLLGGDATDSLEQLHSRRPDAVAPNPRLHVETIDRILAHSRQNPTVYLPSHDRQSAARLEARALL